MCFFPFHERMHVHERHRGFIRTKKGHLIHGPLHILLMCSCKHICIFSPVHHLIRPASSNRWTAPEHSFLGEPVFVPHPQVHLVSWFLTRDLCSLSSSLSFKRSHVKVVSICIAKSYTNFVVDKRLKLINLLFDFTVRQG